MPSMDILSSAISNRHVAQETWSHLFYQHHKPSLDKSSSQSAPVHNPHVYMNTQISSFRGFSLQCQQLSAAVISSSLPYLPKGCVLLSINGVNVAFLPYSAIASILSSTSIRPLVLRFAYLSTPSQPSKTALATESRVPANTATTHEIEHCVWEESIPIVWTSAVSIAVVAKGQSMGRTSMGGTGMGNAASLSLGDMVIGYSKEPIPYTGSDLDLISYDKINRNLRIMQFAAVVSMVGAGLGAREGIEVKEVGEVWSPILIYRHSPTPPSPFPLLSHFSMAEIPTIPAIGAESVAAINNIGGCTTSISAAGTVQSI